MRAFLTTNTTSVAGGREREKKGVTIGENLFLSSVTQKIESK